MALPKWNEDREAKLVAFVGDETPVSQATVAEAADVLETTSRSISSKLRKMGYEVELAATSVKKAFTDEEESALREVVVGSPGQFTYAEIAEKFAGGKFSAKTIQGKILSMELHGNVKAAEKKEVVKKFTDAEEATFISMMKEGKYAEEIAEALGHDLPSIRGKGLSLLKSGAIDKVPTQRDKIQRVDPLDTLEDITEMTVEEIAAAIEKTARGVRTMLTRRGLNCKDHNGEERKAKAASND